MFLKITSFFKNDFRLRKNYDDIREGLPGGSMVNNLPFSAGDLRDVGSIPESGTSPGVRKGSALQYSCLGNPVDRAVWRLRVHGVAKSWTRPSTYTETVLVVVQLQLTLRDPMDSSQPGSSLSVEFSRQEYWSGLPVHSPGDLPNPGIKPGSPALQVDSLLSELQGSTLCS